MTSYLATNKDNYRHDIDGLRGLAVITVILFHSFPEYFGGGFIGVDIFFVISGYLICSILFKDLQAGCFSFIDFYCRRIRRIFPALLCVLFTTYAVGWFLLTPSEYWQLGKHIVGGAAFSANFLYLNESGYFDTASNLKPLLHLWSLGIEEQFYIFWPPVLWLAQRARINLLAVTLTGFLVSFAWNIWAADNEALSMFDFFSPFTRIWELLLGALLAYWVTNIKLIKSSDTRSYFGLTLIVLGVLICANHSGYPGWWALLPTLGTMFLISAGKTASINKILLSNRMMVSLGLISYPLYLWHWPILSFLRILNGEVNAAWIRILCLIVSLGLAYLTYVLVEKPLRFGTNLRIKTLILLGLMAIIAFIGFNTYKRDGLDFRFSKKLQVIDGKLSCPEYSVCTFGKQDSEKIIVLYGDSHASHLTKALDMELGNEYKFYYIYASGCFVSQSLGYPEISEWKECRQIREVVKKLQGQNILAVVTAQKWHGYGLREPKGIEKAIQDKVKAFDLQPKKIVILGSTIDINYSCEISNFYKRRPLSQSSSCTIDDEPMQANKAFIDTTRSMNLSSNIKFVYPYEVICPKGQCTIIDGDIAYYQDPTHLTLHGALKVVKEIREQLER